MTDRSLKTPPGFPDFPRNILGIRNLIMCSVCAVLFFQPEDTLADMNPKSKVGISHRFFGSVSIKDKALRN